MVYATKTKNKTPLRELVAIIANFFDLAALIASSFEFELLFTFLKSISSELYPNYFLSLTFSLSFLYLTQSARLPLALYHSVWSICITYGTSCHTNDHQTLPNFLSREAEGIPRGSKCLMICLYSHA